MTTLFRILLGLIAIAYLISPFDLIPDLYVPFLGWIDDTVLIGLVIYYIRYGRLPGIFHRTVKPAPGDARTRRTASTAGPSPAGNGRARRPADPPPRKSPDPHVILGVKPGATRQEIQAAFREAVKRYHPDKVSHLGKEFQDLANRKFIEIKEAYAALTRG